MSLNACVEVPKNASNAMYPNAKAMLFRRAKHKLAQGRFPYVIYNSFRVGILISQLLGPGTIPSHQLYNLPISRMKMRVL